MILNQFFRTRLRQFCAFVGICSVIFIAQVFSLKTEAFAADAEGETDCTFPDVENRIEVAYKVTESQIKECIERGFDPPPQWLPSKNEGGVIPASQTVFAGQFGPSEPPGSEKGAAASGIATAIIGALAGGLLEGTASDFDGQFDVEAEGHPDAAACGMRGDTKVLTGEHEINEFQCSGSVTGLGVISYFMGKSAELYGVVEPATKQMALYAQQADKYVFVEQVQLPVDWCEDLGEVQISHPITYLPQKLTFPADATNVPLELGPGNYNPETEVVKFNATGTNISIPESCGDKEEVLSPYPSAYPGIRFKPQGEAACYKQYIYPQGGFCDGYVLHINKDDTSFAYEPGTRMTSLPVDSTEDLMIMGAFGTKLYMQSVDIKVGFGETVNFPNGVLILMPNREEFFANGPIALYADASGNITLPHGGVHYAVNGTIIREYENSLNINVSPSSGPLKLQVNDHLIYTDAIAIPANATDHYIRAAYPAAQEVQLAPLTPAP